MGKNIPEIIQPRPSLPLLRPLHNLHTLHLRAKHLHRHLNANSRQLIPQQERGIHSAQTDTQTHPRERVSVLEDHTQDIAGLDTSRVATVIEQCFAVACRVEGRKLGLCDGGDRVFAGFAGAGGWCVDFEWFAGCMESIRYLSCVLSHSRHPQNDVKKHTLISLHSRR